MLQYLIVDGHHVESLRGPFQTGLLLQMLAVCAFALPVNYLIDTFVSTEVYFLVYDDAAMRLVAFACVDWRSVPLPVDLYDAWETGRKRLTFGGAIKKPQPGDPTTKVGHISAIASAMPGVGRILLDVVCAYIARRARFANLDAVPPLQLEFYPKLGFVTTTLFKSNEMGLVPMILKLSGVPAADDPILTLLPNANRSPLLFDTAWAPLVAYAVRTSELVLGFFKQPDDDIARIVFQRMWCRFDAFLTSMKWPFNDVMAVRLHSMRTKYLTLLRECNVKLQAPKPLPKPRIQLLHSTDLVSFDSLERVCDASASSLASLKAFLVDAEEMTRVAAAAAAVAAEARASSIQAAVDGAVASAIAASAVRATPLMQLVPTLPDGAAAIDDEVDGQHVDSDDGADEDYNENLDLEALGVAGRKRKRTYHKRFSSNVLPERAPNQQRVPWPPEPESGLTYTHLMLTWTRLVDDDILPIQPGSEARKAAYISAMLSAFSGGKPGCFGRPPPGVLKRGGDSKSKGDMLPYLKDHIRVASENGTTAADVMDAFVAKKWLPRRNPIFIARKPRCDDD